MQLDSAAAPTDLPTGLPVYPDVAAALATPGPDPSATLSHWAPAHVLSTLAAYAYSDDVDTVATIAARLGFEGGRCVRIATEVDALLITSTAYVVQSADGRVVVVAYRGTRATGLIDFVGDVDSSPERLRVALPGSPGEHHVHAGFYRNVRATRCEVLDALQRALEGRPVTPPRQGDDGPEAAPDLAPMEALYLTGHSLGGAMAALMAVLLAGETDPTRRAIARRLQTVHTFGQPMVGDPEFAAAAARVPWPRLPETAGGPEGSTVGDRLVRWVYRHDVVARFPSTALGRFAHLGRERRFETGRGWVPMRTPSRQLPSVLGLALSPLGLVARTFVLTRDLWWGPSIADHLPENYDVHLAPDDLITEYGD